MDVYPDVDARPTEALRGRVITMRSPLVSDRHGPIGPPPEVAMSAITTTPTAATSSVPTVGSLLRDGVVATVVATVATAAVAAAGQAVGFSLDVAGATIPASGFATLPAFSVIGLLIAVGLRRFSTGRLPQPRGC